MKCEKCGANMTKNMDSCGECGAPLAVKAIDRKRATASKTPARKKKVARTGIRAAARQGRNSARTAAR